MRRPPLSPDARTALHVLPRRGWLTTPTPVTPLPDLAAALGLRWLGAKRDDLIPALGGGTKVRKLDLLLATPRFAEAPAWTSMGALGSGHLVALTAASRATGVPFDAHLFWEPVEGAVTGNLAFTASHARALTYASSRTRLVLRRPGLFVGATHGGALTVGPGGSHPPGVLGVALAALELADQIAAGELPRPDRVDVPLGSGGTAAGLALGLGWAFAEPPLVHAGAAVERPLASVARVRRLAHAAAAWARAHGVDLPDRPLAEVRVDHRFAGPSYGVPSDVSRRTTARLRDAGLPAEPIYTGKAYSALLAAPPPGQAVLLWTTPRRDASLPTAPDWRDRLPAALRARLEGRGVRRRTFILGGAAAGLTAFALWRTAGYPPRGAGAGHLAAWEAAVLQAAAEVVAPDEPALRPAIERVPAAVEAFTRAFPAHMKREISALLAAVEHGTLAAGHVARFSDLGRDDRTRYLEALADLPAGAHLLYRGLRDLCVLGLYQRDESWPAIGYGGPLVAPERRADAYDGLRAPAHEAPAGWEVA